MPQSLLRLVLRHATAGSGQPRASCPTSTSSALSFTSALKGEGPAGARGGETSLSRRRPSGPASTRADNEHLHEVVAVPVSRPERRHAPAAPPRAPPLPRPPLALPACAPLQPFSAIAVTGPCSTNNVRRPRTQVENGRSSSPRAIQTTHQVSILYRVARRTRWCRRRVVGPTRSAVKSP